MQKLYLSTKNKKIGGVCGGIAETYDLDPSLVRIAAVFLCLATLAIPVIVTYIIAWFVIPSNPHQ